jgi:hypothetical protein
MPATPENRERQTNSLMQECRQIIAITQH